MRYAVPIVAVSLLSSSALGEEGPKRVKTQIVRENPVGMSVLYGIDQDGTVWIDWKTVETIASTKADPTKLPIAQLMLAIRDGTWKPLQQNR
jgi:hypothetical protein